MTEFTKLSFAKLVDLYAVEQEVKRPFYYRSVYLPEICNRLDTQVFQAIDDLLLSNNFPFSSNYEKLLMVIFGRDLSKTLVEREIHNLATDKSNPTRVKKDFERLVLSKALYRVMNGELSHPVSLAEAQLIDNSLTTLKDREAVVIKMRFGLGCEAQTLAQIGEHFGVGRERIRQIEARALRKLRHPSRSRSIRSLIMRPMAERLVEASNCLAAMCTSDADVSLQAEYLQHVPYVRDLIQSHAVQVQWYEKEIARLSANQKDLELVADIDFLDVSVDELELSVRTYNCLRNADFRTVREFASKTEKEILRIKNFGKKSFAELRDLLAAKGLSFAQEYLD